MSYLRTSAMVRNRYLRIEQGAKKVQAGECRNRCGQCGEFKLGHVCSRPEPVMEKSRVIDTSAVVVATAARSPETTMSVLTPMDGTGLFDRFLPMVEERANDRPNEMVLPPPAAVPSAPPMLGLSPSFSFGLMTGA